MPEIKTEYLFTIALDVEVFNLGDGSHRSGGTEIVRRGVDLI